MKIRTISQLQTILDEDYSWRLKEIADVKAAVKGSELSNRTLIRAGVALLYAHWEGFVKLAATHYVTFIDLQGKRFDELQTCFWVIGMKKHLSDMLDSKKSKTRVAAIDFIRTCAATSANLKVKAAIDTQSNLKSEVFDNILTSIGISTTPYEARYHLMDESLLARRNRIAHGEFAVDLDSNGWRNLADEVIQLLRDFKTDIENAASTSAYIRSK
jgi:hypothetical protein